MGSSLGCGLNSESSTSGGASRRPVTFPSCPSAGPSHTEAAQTLFWFPRFVNLPLTWARRAGLYISPPVQEPAAGEASIQARLQRARDAVRCSTKPRTAQGGRKEDSRGRLARLKEEEREQYLLLCRLMAHNIFLLADDL